MIHLRQLKHFLTVFDHGSFLQASQTANISQPAISKSIHSLEQHYGVTLFKRLPRGVEPTTFAIALEQHARRILLDFEHSNYEMSIMAQGSSGLVRIGVGRSFIRSVNDAILDLHALHPGIDYSVMTDHADRLHQALLSNRIDLYVGMTNRIMHDPSCLVESISSDKYVGLCSADHPFAGKSVSIDELLLYDWIVPEIEEAGRTALEAYFTLHKKPKPTFKIVTNSIEVVYQSLRQTRLLSVMPEGSHHEMPFEELARFYPIDFEFERNVGIVRRQNFSSSPLIEKYIHHLRERLGSLDKLAPVKPAVDPQTAGI
jgi:DNA-binding transcriptional LysR family regulator